MIGDEIVGVLDELGESVRCRSHLPLAAVVAAGCAMGLHFDEVLWVVVVFLLLLFIRYED